MIFGCETDSIDFRTEPDRIYAYFIEPANFHEIFDNLIDITNSQKATSDLSFASKLQEDVRKNALIDGLGTTVKIEDFVENEKITYLLKSSKSRKFEAKCTLEFDKMDTKVVMDTRFCYFGIYRIN